MNESSTYLWVMVALLCLESIGRIFWLAKGVFPKRTAGQTSVDLIFGLVMLFWTLAVIYQ